MTDHGRLQQQLVRALAAWGRRPLVYILCNRSNLTAGVPDSSNDECWRSAGERLSVAVST